jgi:ribosomal protein L44E
MAFRKVEAPNENPGMGSRSPKKNQAVARDHQDRRVDRAQRGIGGRNQVGTSGPK